MSRGRALNIGREAARQSAIGSSRNLEADRLALERERMRSQAMAQAMQQLTSAGIQGTGQVLNFIDQAPEREYRHNQFQAAKREQDLQEGSDLAVEDLYGAQAGEEVVPGRQAKGPVVKKGFERVLDDPMGFFGEAAESLGAGVAADTDRVKSAIGQRKDMITGEGLTDGPPKIAAPAKASEPGFMDKAGDLVKGLFDDVEVEPATPATPDTTKDVTQDEAVKRVEARLQKDLESKGFSEQQAKAGVIRYREIARNKAMKTVADQSDTIRLELRQGLTKPELEAGKRLGDEAFGLLDGLNRQIAATTPGYNLLSQGEKDALTARIINEEVDYMKKNGLEEAALGLQQAKLDVERAKLAGGSGDPRKLAEKPVLDGLREAEDGVTALVQIEEMAAMQTPEGWQRMQGIRKTMIDKGLPPLAATSAMINIAAGIPVTKGIAVGGGAGASQSVGQYDIGQENEVILRRMMAELPPEEQAFLKTLGALNFSFARSKEGGRMTDADWIRWEGNLPNALEGPEVFAKTLRNFSQTAVDNYVKTVDDYSNSFLIPQRHIKQRGQFGDGFDATSLGSKNADIEGMPQKDFKDKSRVQRTTASLTPVGVGKSAIKEGWKTVTDEVNSWTKRGDDNVANYDEKQERAQALLRDNLRFLDHTDPETLRAMTGEIENGEPSLLGDADKFLRYWKIQALEKFHIDDPKRLSVAQVQQLNQLMAEQANDPEYRAERQEAYQAKLDLKEFEQDEKDHDLRKMSDQDFKDKYGANFNRGDAAKLKSELRKVSKRKSKYSDDFDDISLLFNIDYVPETGRNRLRPRVLPMKGDAVHSQTGTKEDLERAKAAAQAEEDDPLLKTIEGFGKDTQQQSAYTAEKMKQLGNRPLKEPETIEDALTEQNRLLGITPESEPQSAAPAPQGLDPDKQAKAEEAAIDFIDTAIGQLVPGDSKGKSKLEAQMQEVIDNPNVSKATKDYLVKRLVRLKMRGE